MKRNSRTLFHKNSWALVPVDVPKNEKWYEVFVPNLSATESEARKLFSDLTVANREKFSYKQRPWPKPKNHFPNQDCQGKFSSSRMNDTQYLSEKFHFLQKKRQHDDEVRVRCVSSINPDLLWNGPYAGSCLHSPHQSIQIWRNPAQLASDIENSSIATLKKQSPVVNMSQTFQKVQVHQVPSYMSLMPTPPPSSPESCVTNKALSDNEVRQWAANVSDNLYHALMAYHPEYRNYIAEDLGHLMNNHPAMIGRCLTGFENSKISSVSESRNKYSNTSLSPPTPTSISSDQLLQPLQSESGSPSLSDEVSDKKFISPMLAEIRKELANNCKEVSEIQFTNKINSPPSSCKPNFCTNFPSEKKTLPVNASLPPSIPIDHFPSSYNNYNRNFHLSSENSNISNIEKCIQNASFPDMSVPPPPITNTATLSTLSHYYSSLPNNYYNSLQSNETNPHESTNSLKPTLSNFSSSSILDFRNSQISFTPRPLHESPPGYKVQNYRKMTFPLKLAPSNSSTLQPYEYSQPHRWSNYNPYRRSQSYRRSIDQPFRRYHSYNHK